MTLSAIHIARWVLEAAPELVGRVVTSLHKDEMRKLVTLELAGPETLMLYYLFLPGESLICFEKGKPSGDARAHRTTNFLPQLVGGRVTTVEQAGFDRIVKITLAGQRDDFVLMFELFGPSSNLFLLDSRNEVITSLKNSPDGHVYELPGQPRGIPPYEVTAGRLVSTARSRPQETLRSLLELEVRGCDASFWDLVLGPSDQSTPAGEIDEGEMESIVHSIVDTYDRCTRRRREIAVTESGLRWRAESDEGQCYTRLNDAMADAAHELSYRSAMRSVRQRVSQALKNARKRLEEKIEKLRKLLDAADDAAHYRQWAELLTVNIGRISKGMSSVTVTNLYDEHQGEIAIPLQKNLSPSANIAGLFRKYRKLTDGVSASKKQASEIQGRLAVLESYRDQLENATDLTHLLSLERSLIKDGILSPLKRRPSVHRPEPSEKYNPRVFATAAGETILVGRNNRENEYVTFVAAKKHDIWFHSQQTPGSHVVLKLKDKSKPPSHESIVEAAQIAAHFSQARTSSKVPIIYAEVRYIQKIRGGPPGEVRYSRVKSIMVEAKAPQSKS